MKYLLILLLIFAGCNKKIAPPIKVGPPTVKVEKVMPGELIVDLKGVEEKAVEFSTTVYFEFDSDTVEEKYLTGNYIHNGSEELYLYGNTCDIGTEEYNLRLGYRRGNAVYNYLKDKVNCRMNIISLGESEATGNKAQDRCVHITTERQ